MKIAVFNPLNIRKNNAFGTGEHPVFEYLVENYNYNITYFIEKPDGFFGKIFVKNIKRNFLKTFFLQLLRIFFGKYKYYWKIPYYDNLDFSSYDLVITEGVHYLILDYFKNISKKVILSDSISREFSLKKIQKNFLNKYFDKSLAIVVNDKLPILYKKNNLKIKTTTIGHAIKTDDILYIKREKFFGKLVSVGRLSEEKGFDYIIKAVCKLKEKNFLVTLDIFGQGPEKENLQKLIKELKLENQVFLKGFLEHSKLMAIFGNYDLFISHPLETPYIAEAFLMANMEAMASGLPVITTDCGGVPLVVKNKAIVLPQKDISQIAESIEYLAKNPNLYEKMSVDGAKYARENFSIKVIAEQLNNAFINYYKNENNS